MLGEVLEKGVFVLDLKLGLAGDWSGTGVAHNHVGLHFCSNDGESVDALTGSQVRFAVGEDLAVVLTFPARDLSACSVPVDHGHECSIARASTAERS